MVDRARVLPDFAAFGLDVVHRFDARRVARELELPVLATAPVGIIVGNTRVMWPAFLAARRADPALRASRDPIQHYVEAALAGTRALFSHRRYASEPLGEPVPLGRAGAFLPFQRVAVAAGLGALSPTHFVIHPQYGPWFSLRAIVLVDDEAPPPPAPLPPAPCDCRATACRALFDRALAGGDWRAWLAAREACCVGRDYRYPDDQIRYHYLKDLAVLG